MKINKKKFLLTVEKVFTVVSLLLYSGGILTVILSGGASEGDNVKIDSDSSLIQLIFLLIYLVTCLLLLLRWKKVIYIVSQVRFAWLLLFFSIASIAWSADPQTTQIRCIALVGTTLFGMYFGTRYTLKEQLLLTNWMIIVAIVLSLLFAVALPKYGIMTGTHSGALRGIYNHKNVLGKIMVLAGINCLFSAMSNKSNRVFLWLMFSISIICLVFSRSTSSMVNFINLISMFFLLRIVRSPAITISPALSGIALIGMSLYLFVQNNLNTLLGSIGKDTTLTGRGDLWPLVLDKIWERPWLGYGFSGFWKQGFNGEAASIWYDSGWTPPNSHNGFLDIWLELGLVGLIIFIIGFLILLSKSLSYVRASNNIEGFWPAICLFYLIIINLTESSLLIQNNMFWILYIATEVTMVIIEQQKKVQVISS